MGGDWVTRVEWLTDGIGALMKDTPESCALLSTMRGHSERVAVWQPGRGGSPAPWTLTVDLPAPRTAQNECCRPWFVVFCESGPNGLTQGTGTEK